MQPEEIEAVVAISEMALHTACFVSAVLGAIAVTFRDDRFRTCISLFGIAFCSGIVATFFVSICVHFNGGYDGAVPLYITASGIIGISGRWAEKRIMLIFESLIDKALTLVGAEDEKDVEDSPK